MSRAVREMQDSAHDLLTRMIALTPTEPPKPKHTAQELAAIVGVVNGL